LDCSVQIVPNFIAAFPDFAQANSGMIAKEDGQRSADVGDDGPLPHSVKLGLQRMGIGSALLHGGQGPHGEIGHQEVSDDFATRLAPLLISGEQRPLVGVQDEDGLRDALNQSGQRCQHDQQFVRVIAELRSQNRENAARSQRSLEV